MSEPEQNMSEVYGTNLLSRRTGELLESVDGFLAVCHLERV